MKNLIGKTIDEYLIEAIIGTGGMGVVYRAVDTTLNRVAALKMLLPTLAEDENFVKRFNTEAKALAQMDHTNVVRIYSFKNVDEGLFIAMQFIDGHTLMDHINSGPIVFPKAMPIFRQCLNGLQHAHSQKIIHRDIKAHNILIDQKGVVKISDFGLARIRHGGNTTYTENTAGTLKYMAPEQVRGDKDTNHRCDIYAMGMTFYEVLAGRTPFDENMREYEIYNRILAGNLPSPREYQNEIPEHIAKIILKSIEQNPDKRYQSASQMLGDLEKFRSTDEPLIIEPPSEESKPPEIRKVLGISGMFLLLTVLFIWIIYPWTNDKNDFPNDHGSAAVEQPFHLRVFSDPPMASIMVNGINSGSTPTSELIVSNKIARIEAVKKGFERYYQIHNLQRGGVDSIYITLTPATEPASEITTEITISSKPANANIKIDGRYYGTTPNTISDLAPGTHVLELSRSDYRTKKIRLKIVKGENPSAHYQLQAVGYLQVKNAPVGAKVMVAGKSLGSAAELFTLSVGSHRIRIVHPDFEHVEQGVGIYHGRTKEISVTMQRLTGILKVKVDPKGDIYIGSNQVAKDTQFWETFRLETGQYQVKAYHALIGEKEITVTVKANRTTRKLIKLID